MGSQNRGTAEQKAPNEQTSPRGQPAPDLARGRGGLARYVAAAALARTADGGAVVAIVLMVTTSGAPGWLAGLLGACITAPHLMGPLVARSLDSCRDGRVLIAWACVVHGATLAAAVLLYPVTWPALTGVLLVASGLVGPLLTGGISSRLPAIAGPDQVSQRRAQGWDVATYGIGGTIGPSVVAAVSAWAGPTAAALILAAGHIRCRRRRSIAALRSSRSGGSRGSAAGPDPAAHGCHRPPSEDAVPDDDGGVLRCGASHRGRSLHCRVPGPAGSRRRSDGRLRAGRAGRFGRRDVPSAAGRRRPAGHAARGIGRRGACRRRVDRVVCACRRSIRSRRDHESYFFAATLAARSEFAPPQVRGQVFVWVGALKIAAGSAGTAAAGIVITGEPQLPLFLAAALVLAVAGTSVLDRRSAAGLETE